MKVRIGVEHSPRDFTLETDLTADELANRLEEAISNGSLFKVEDVKGDIVMIPGAKVSHLEFSNQEPRKVGFLG